MMSSINWKTERQWEGSQRSESSMCGLFE